MSTTTTQLQRMYWLAKSEPDAYSISDLQRDRTTLWDGVRNYQVRNFFRDQMRVGDRVLFYHSNTTIPGVVGEMEVVKTDCIDPTQFDTSDEHYDPKSPLDAPRWIAPRMQYRATFTDVIPLEKLRTLRALQASPLVRKGNRLSVIPLSKSEYTAITKLARIAT